MKLELEDYQKQNIEKLDATSAGVSIEKRHKVFIKKYNINLSALVRDVLNKLIDKKEEEEKNHEKENKV